MKDRIRSLDIIRHSDFGVLCNEHKLLAFTVMSQVFSMSTNMPEIHKNIEVLQTSKI